MAESTRVSRMTGRASMQAACGLPGASAIAQMPRRRPPGSYTGHRSPNLYCQGTVMDADDERRGSLTWENSRDGIRGLGSVFIGSGCGWRALLVGPASLTTVAAAHFSLGHEDSCILRPTPNPLHVSSRRAMGLSCSFEA